MTFLSLLLHFHLVWDSSWEGGMALGNTPGRPLIIITMLCPSQRQEREDRHRENLESKIAECEHLCTSSCVLGNVCTVLCSLLCVSPVWLHSAAVYMYTCTCVLNVLINIQCTWSCTLWVLPDLPFFYLSLNLHAHISGDPNSDSNIDGDPFKTLFVGRIVSQCMHLHVHVQVHVHVHFVHV